MAPNPELDRLFAEGASGRTKMSEKDLDAIRRAILTDGIDADEVGMSPLRPYTWCILLSTFALPTTTYLALLKRGPSADHHKIKDDTFRTLAKDPLFLRRVTNNSLTRILNAVAWNVPYVQGINVLAAPFTYVCRSEPMAYSCLSKLLQREIPSYVRGACEGVHRGVALVDRCLEVLDPKLSGYLRARSVDARVYAFSPVLTLSACTPPLPQVLVLWDFLLAYGVHLNVLAVVAQLHLMRDQLLEEESPGKLLRQLPNLQGRKVVELVLSFVGRLDGELYKEVVEHTA